MKNQILIFLLGFFISVSLAMAIKPAEEIIIIPAKPKQTMVLDCQSQSQCVSKIKYYIGKGYITKSVAGTSQYGYSWVVVMEKY